MSRMSREFSLVLLGAGVLTAGYFAAPSPDEELEKKAEEQATQQVHSQRSGSTYHRVGYMPLIWVHSPGYVGSPGGGRPTAMTSVSRGGFGGIGHASSSGG